MFNLSLICPTINRSTLARTIESVLPQLGEHDEFIIVSDGPSNENIRGLVAAVQECYPQVIFQELEKRVGDFGCTPCDIGIEMASGDYVFFIGDDDITAPDAFNVIRRGVALDPGIPHVFAMMHTGNKLSNTIEVCHVSGQQIVVPRNPWKMPKMAHCPPEQIRVSDAVFIHAVYRAWGQVKFHDEVIATLPCQNDGRFR